MNPKAIHSITSHQRIDGVVPGVRGQRAFPVHQLRVVDPFVMLDHIGPERLPATFRVDGQMHPHRGFETITMMFEGIMHHVDSAGFRETLRSGSTQNMVAGSGIQHGGDMEADPKTQVFHEVQLWVNMPARNKMEPPRITSAHAGDKPVVQLDHGNLEVLAGSAFGLESPIATTQPTTVARYQSSDAGSMTISDINPTWNCLVYLLQGSATLNGQSVPAFSTVRFKQVPGDIEIVTPGDPVDMLILAGKPIDEPVALGGPFVMNTQAEIEQAQADYAAGAFDAVTLASESPLR